MSLSMVKHTIKVSSAETSACDYCGQRLDGQIVDWSINHLVQEHAGKILHVGCESLELAGAPPYYATIAVVGFDEVPPKREASVKFATQLPPAV